MAGSPRQRVAIVTGASRGIGRATAIELAAAGYSIVAAYNTNRPAIDEVVGNISGSGGQAIAVGGDIRQPSTNELLIDAARKRFGRLDLVVANAGYCPFVPFLDQRLDDFDQVISINLRAPFLLMQLAAKLMIEQGNGGRLVCVGSVSGVVGAARLAAYGASKAGLFALVKSVAAEVGKYGITCNAVLPGIIETDLNTDHLARPNARETSLESTALKRFGTPADVAAAIRFLASEQASYVTGAGLIVDGGIVFTSP
jgi:NAD(P)-dependent dehydrogenase (short-subunit alcohol dehydrogenase family)